MFEQILVAVDGSKYGQYATDFAFLFAEKMNSQLTFQHVIDTRMADFFVEPEFAAELGLAKSNDTTDKIMSALHKLGKLVLNLVEEQAKKHNLRVSTICDEGYVLYEVMRRAADYNLLVVGHRGRGESRRPSSLAIGSVAERVTLASKTPVLIACKSPRSVTEILVAYDGSEPAIGALLMAEQLAKQLTLPLRVIHVATSKEKEHEARFLVAQGEQYLREAWDKPVFFIKTGVAADILLEQSSTKGSLLVLGAYGFRNADSVVVGTTTTHMIRRAQSNLLIYR